MVKAPSEGGRGTWEGEIWGIRNFSRNDARARRALRGMFGIISLFSNMDYQASPSLNISYLGYGVFNAFNGIYILASGAIMGYLYTWAPLSVCIFSATIELGGLFVLIYFLRKR